MAQWWLDPRPGFDILQGGRQTLDTFTCELKTNHLCLAWDLLGSMAAVAEPMNSCIEPQLPSIHAIRPQSVTNEPINLRLKEFPAAEINFNNQPRMS
ncbi:hypothetical protein PCANC_02856 [Puccinia coronata f. sp. avenae]|uniref:Uncharacterized protein n=1 Tax=Puccinia coronata f. sp. avenae TaxID=200324 RepID=A0A2N5W430_9BASI|nr:hypothetical protein PCANC_14279 [Puccinia coronata f. sp. avenae]PLW56950.1 hypothetical protein PCANC_02856 [Puccinia coronata f. sp. avenae]